LGNWALFYTPAENWAGIGVRVRLEQNFHKESICLDILVKKQYNKYDRLLGKVQKAFAGAVFDTIPVYQISVQGA
jgi:hypothetical protein